jgi:hypothetical protein
MLRLMSLVVMLSILNVPARPVKAAVGSADRPGLDSDLLVPLPAPDRPGTGGIIGGPCKQPVIDSPQFVKFCFMPA